MALRAARSTTVLRLGLALAAALVAGALLGHPWMALALAALALLGLHTWRLQRLVARLQGRRRASARGTGLWGELDQQLERRQREMRARKLRLLGMLRAYRAAAAALPDAVVVVDRDHQRALWFNEAAGHLLGLRYPDDIDAPLGERLQPLPLAHWLAAGRNAEPLLDVASPADPDLRLNLRLIPYSDELWLLVARDVTKVVRLEHMRRDFVANVSHELRTPLTVIHGYLEMLDPAERPDWAPMLGEMRRQSERMRRLVEDLLALSRLEAQDAVADEEVAMAPMLAALRREAEALSQQRHAISVEDEAGVDLLGSPGELHSAFSNLVSNAVRYTPAGGSVRIRFRRDGDGVVLAVEDSGVGIPAANLPRLTERFYRVSTSRSRESGGTGLGLAIVKHVLGLHQARLDIRSEVGHGSSFACRFGADRVLPRAGARGVA
ncbi:MAG: phosphate regulon sensor histidine kinase PhoR [Lysobacteraceae bacterium]